jgi:hypothetical protein
MIRPVTLVCWILALGAGLYLYRAKHEVELIDQHIDQIARQTSDLRVESRGLLDEWIRLGEPEQLHKYSDEYLGLQPISPGQFARMTDLAARLPPTQPDPPEEQADVVAQSSAITSAVVALPDSQSPGGAPADGSDAAVANADPGNAAVADAIPVPPIPPAVIPIVARVAASSGAALPLQARPVTPRLADGQAEQDAARPHAATSPPAADEPRTDAASVTLAAPAEPHPGSTNGPPGGQPHGMPPLQAQGGHDASGLPPLQAQAPTREIAQGPGRGPAPGPGLTRTPAPAPGPRADNHPNEPPREIRPSEPPPPRGAGAQNVRPGPSETEQAQLGPLHAAPAQGGSLLGMSRGPAPLPLPTPTPMNANWSGPTGTGSPGSGR